MSNILHKIILHPLFRNIIGFLAGLFIGGMINMAIIMISSSIIPPPNGVDVTTAESLKANMHLFKPINFLMPFLAHALGTLVGAFLVTKFSATYKLMFAMLVGIFFMYGGYQMIQMLPSPTWFSVTDLVFAYIPMAYLGYYLSKKYWK
jgi:hypothetical protein